MSMSAQLPEGNFHVKGEVAHGQLVDGHDVPVTKRGNLDAKRVEEAMARVGIETRGELAQKLKTSPSNVTRWLNGEKTPGGRNLTKLCRLLRVTPEYLIGEPGAQSYGVASLDWIVEETRKSLGNERAEILLLMNYLDDAEAKMFVERARRYIEAVHGSFHREPGPEPQDLEPEDRSSRSVYPYEIRPYPPTAFHERSSSYGETQPKQPAPKTRPPRRKK